MKKCVKVLTGLLAVMVIGTMNSAEVVRADAVDDIEQIVHTSTWSDETQAEDIVTNVMKGTDFYQGGAKISVLSKNSINVYGHTFAYHDCDSIDLYLYVEKYVGNSWQSYKSFKYTDENVSTLSKSVTMTVPSGYSYRLRGYHRTYNDGRQESSSTKTDGVYVG